MSENRNQGSLLPVICKPMQVWLAVIVLSYVLIQFVFPEWMGPLYRTNGQVFAQARWFNILGAVFFVVAYFLNVVGPRSEWQETARAFVIILLSVMLLALAVFLTGGFTDSPFAGAVALYIGFFIILNRKQAYPLANRALILITVVFLAAPYVQLCRQGYAEVHILQWNDNPKVLWSRWGISILILLIAALVGDRISHRVSTTS